MSDYNISTSPNLFLKHLKFDKKVKEKKIKLEKKLPQIRKLYLTDKLTIPAIADELGYTKNK